MVGKKQQKERRIYDPVRKGQDSYEVFGLAGPFIGGWGSGGDGGKRTPRVTGKGETGRGRGGPLSREWIGYKQGEIRISGRSNSRKGKKRR